MHGWLERSVFHLMKLDSNYLSELAKMTPDEREDHYDNLIFLDRCRQELERSGHDCRTLHAEVSRLTQHCVSAPSEIDVPVRLAQARQIAFAIDSDQKRQAFTHADDLMRRTLVACPVPVIRFYGGVKDDDSIAAKISAYESGSELDLDDVIRFRAVIANLDETMAFAKWLANTFCLVRLRNYYVRPRNGVNDPYRAVHALIPGLNGTLIELQVVSALREAVGLFDHSLVLKKTLAYINRQHCRWLRNLSFVANVVDGGLAAHLVQEGCFVRNQAQNKVHVLPSDFHYSAGRVSVSRMATKSLSHRVGCVAEKY